MLKYKNFSKGAVLQSSPRFETGISASSESTCRPGIEEVQSQSREESSEFWAPESPWPYNSNSLSGIRYLGGASEVRTAGYFSVQERRAAGQDLIRWEWTVLSFMIFSDLGNWSWSSLGQKIFEYWYYWRVPSSPECHWCNPVGLSVFSGWNLCLKTMIIAKCKVAKDKHMN